MDVIVFFAFCRRFIFETGVTKPSNVSGTNTVRFASIDSLVGVVGVFTQYVVFMFLSGLRRVSDLNRTLSQEFVFFL